MKNTHTQEQIDAMLNTAERLEYLAECNLGRDRLCLLAGAEAIRAVSQQLSYGASNSVACDMQTECVKYTVRADKIEKDARNT